MAVRRILSVVPILLLVGLAPATAQAHACADYPNQAAAQRAADTRDADGDGIYCEDLPCPCLKPGSGSGGSSQPGHRRTNTGGLGASIPLHPVRKRSGCHLRGPLPDAGCTPGTRYRRVGKDQVCTPGYAGRVRNVPQSRKNAVYAAYGISQHFNGQDGEVDHLVSLELGGTNAAANLFPEAASPRPGSHEKDRLENRLHSEICSGEISLRQAQQLIATNWVKAYRQRFASARSTAIAGGFSDGEPASSSVVRPRITFLRLVEKGYNPGPDYYVTETVTLRACAARGHLSLRVRERKEGGDGSIIAEHFRAFGLRQGQRCQTHTARWKLGDSFFGIGYYRLRFTVIDRFGRRSPAVFRQEFTGD
jgi:hypothetical protein